VAPGAGFGTLVGSVSTQLSPSHGARFDLAYERVGTNGNLAPGTSDSALHVKRYIAGVGIPVKVELGPTLAFVSGQTGVAAFGRPRNLGSQGVGLYLGAATFPAGTADNLQISSGSDGSATQIALNLPLGLQFQPDPRVALTFSVAYSGIFEIPQNGGSTQSLHFLPVSFEAVASPVPAVDVGASVMLDGYLASSSGGGSGPGFFDLRAVQLFLRFRG
jgi:hypothetical protein